MDIRGQRTWCDDCTAVVVLPDNVPIIELFLEALPAWIGGSGLLGSVLMEGFDRAQILALLELRGITAKDRPDTWAALADLESDYRTIRAAQAAERPAT